MSKFVGVIVGSAEVAAGIALSLTGTGAAFAPYLIAGGTATLISGLGTLLSKGPLKGFATTERNPTAAWQVGYGRFRTGGTLVYQNTWGHNNQMLDMVIVLAAHQCEAVDVVLFDQQRVQIDTNAAPSGAISGSGTSFSPLQQRVNITTIQRSQGVVTVTLVQDIPYLIEGDHVFVTEDGAGTLTAAHLVGTFSVAQIISRIGGALIFTYLNGGADITISGHGDVRTLWADYGRNVYFEMLLGGQALGETFKGMAPFGTPYKGDKGNFISPEDPGNVGPYQDNPDIENAPNPWTSFCSLQGKTAVFLRLHYDQSIFKGGIPQITFLCRGKNDIFDPRTSTHGYTENAALCIADFLANETWGFRAQYGTEIPDDFLIAAANTCDEQVPLALSTISPPLTEPAYTCNGKFELTLKRGTILQNLLTSCAGRLSITGGQYIIWPAAWIGNSFDIGGSGGGLTSYPAFAEMAAGGPAWRPAPGVRDLFNGVKGTYISVADKYMAADIPPYAQDDIHGYGSDANLTADGGDRRWFDIQLPFTTSAATAQRIAKIELLRKRQFGQGTLPCSMAAYPITAMDLGFITFPFFGWVDKQVEVIASRLEIAEGGEGTAPHPIVNLDLQEVSPDIYEWNTSEELSPQGYHQPGGGRSFFATEQIPGFSAPFPWMPASQGPLIGDALYPGPKVGSPLINAGQATFGLQIQYGLESDGSVNVEMEVEGVLPPSVLSGIEAAQITCVGSSSGGNMPGGQYVVVASALDGSQSPPQNARLSTPVVVTVPSTSPPSSDGSIEVSISWPAGATAAEIYVCLLRPALYGGAQSGATGYPYQQTIESPTPSVLLTDFLQNGPGAPDSSFDHLAVAWKKVIHGGPWAQQIQSLTATTLTIGGNGMTSDMWADRVLTLLGKADPTQELIVLNMPVSGSSASSGTSDVGTSAELVGSMIQQPSDGDAVAIAGKPYTFQTTLTDSDGNVQIDHLRFEQTLSNLINAINLTGQPGIEYALSTGMHPDIYATTGETGGRPRFGFLGRKLVLVAKVAGASGNSFSCSATPSIGWQNSGIFSGGSDPGAPDAFTLTIGPNSAGDQLPDLTMLLAPDDLVLMRFSPTFGPQSFIDPLIANPYYPSGAINVESGHIALVLTGPDAGDAQVIASFNKDIYGNFTEGVLAAPWSIQPNDGDIITILEAGYGPEFHTHPMPASYRGQVAGVIGSPKVTNLAGQTWAFIARSQNAAGDNGNDAFARVREVFIFGGQGTRQITGSSPPGSVGMLPTDRIVDCDATNGAVTYLLLPFAILPNMMLLIQKIDITPNPVTVQCAGSPPVDTINGESTVTLSSQWDYVIVSISAE